MPDSFNFFSTEKTTEVSSEQNKDTDVYDEKPCCSKDLKEGGRTAETTEEEEGEEENEEKEETSGESDMEEAVQEDVFIRSSGLMSHSYQLDLSVSSGWLTFCLLSTLK